MKRPIAIMVIWSLCLVGTLVAISFFVEGDLRDVIHRMGAWGPLLLVLLQASRPVTWIPGPMLTPAAGYLFGFWKGLLLSWAGLVGAVLVGYALPRLIGMKRVRELVERNAPSLLNLAEGNSFVTVVIARLLPGIPANLVSYAAGAVGFPLGPYVVGSAVGVLPRLVLQTLIGTGLYALGVGA